jgi:hypothetical protein
MMVVYGGQAARKGPMFGDVWGLDLREPMAPRWVNLSAGLTGDQPGTRSAHTAVYDARRQQMVVFGGKGATAKEVWAFHLGADLADLGWQRVVAGDVEGAPGSLSDHGAVWIDAHDCMLVYGGSGRSGESALTWMYHPADGAGHNWRPDPGGCDPFDKDSACGARVVVRVFRDVRCDGFYNPGYDSLLANATVDVTSPAQGQMFTALTDSRGRAMFDGLEVPAGQPLSITITHPAAGGACGYGSGAVSVPGTRFGPNKTAMLTIGVAPN